MPVFCGTPLQRTVSPFNKNMASATGMVLFLYSALPERRTVDMLVKFMADATALSADKVIIAVGDVVLLNTNSPCSWVGTTM